MNAVLGAFWSGCRDLLGGAGPHRHLPMKAVTRSALSLSALVVCVCVTPAPSRAAFDLFGAVDGQGADLLVDPYPFFVFPNAPRIARIIFQSDDYEGVVTLQATCCTDMSGGAVLPSGLNVVAMADIGVNTQFHQPRFSPYVPGSVSTPPAPVSVATNHFSTRAHELRYVGLKVTMAGNPGPTPLRFFAQLDAIKNDGTSATTKVLINVLPTLMDAPTPACLAFIDVPGSDAVLSGTTSAGTSLVPSDSLSAFVNSLFMQKAGDPNRNQWDFGYFMRKPTGGFGSPPGFTTGQYVVLSKSMSSLTPTKAIFVFTNTTLNDKQYVAFNTSGCTPTAKFQLKFGETAFFTADSLTTSTILFREFDGKAWQNISIMSGGPFWILFGGKEVDFTWIEAYASGAIGITSP
jgi:hypothetical protein